MNTKKCTKCGLELSLDCFHKQKDGKYGVNAKCKTCRRAHYQENKEEIKAKSIAYHHDNSEEIKAKKKVYYEANKEYFAAKYKAYNEAHKEKMKAYHKDYRESNKEKAAAYNKDWAQANPEKSRAASRKRRAMRKLVNENYTAADETYTMDLFDNMCYNCDSKDNLHIDHHKPLSKGNALTRDNAVVLCQSCNSSKGTKSPSEFYQYWDNIFLMMKLGIN